MLQVICKIILIFNIPIPEKLKSFLAEFYQETEDGGKDFKYGQQLVSESTFFLNANIFQSLMLYDHKRKMFYILLKKVYNLKFYRWQLTWKSGKSRGGGVEKSRKFREEEILLQFVDILNFYFYIL